MALYKIEHREELVGWYYIEADNKEEAMAEWERQLNHGEIDFSDLALVDSSDTPILVEELTICGETDCEMDEDYESEEEK